MDVLISDHEVIYCTRKKGKSKVFRSEFTGRSYKNCDKDILQNKLTTHDWTDYMDIDDVNLCWEYILHQITTAIDDTCPIKKRIVDARTNFGSIMKFSILFLKRTDYGIFTSQDLVLLLLTNALTPYVPQTGDM